MSMIGSVRILISGYARLTAVAVVVIFDVALRLCVSWLWRMSCANGPYSVTPLPLVGAEVRGIDLKQNTPTSVVERIKQDVYLHRLLVFKYQGVISGERQVEISKWFGDLESTFYKHPRSPHLDVFRVSNDASEGCTNVGRTGWHIDGSFMHEPFSHSIYHMVNVPKSGNTGKIVMLLDD